MLAQRISIILFALCAIVSFHFQASAQGGWRQWEIRMVDGTSVEANPLQMRKDGRFTRSMDPKEPGFNRSKIDYLAASTKILPPAPTGKFKQDLIVFLDGKRSLGKVTFKSVKFSEGTIVQNGKEVSLENVAYIKFAHPATKPQKAGKG
jgi:hypothetical protein